jgi:site-specific DNA-cytosine methylase
MKQIFTSARFVGFKFVVVSLFSGMGGIDTGFTRSGMTIGYANDANFHACLTHIARFKHDDGTPAMTPFIEIDQETYKSIKANVDTQDYCGIIDGKYYRTRLVQEITGQEIRAMIEHRYGKNVIIVLSSGAPCQEMSLMSIKARRGKTNPTGKNSKHLVLEFTRIVAELQPDVICAEEVPELTLPQNKDVYDKMMEELNAMPYSIIENDLCSCHYGGAQIRWRHFMLAIHAKYKTMPVFPTADPNSAKRVKDVLPYVKYFSSEQFTDKVKTSNYVLCTITRGTPAFFWDGEGRKWTPTLRELMKFVGFDEDHIIPEGVPDSQVRLAIGNTICTYTAEAIGRSLIKSITDTLSSDDGLIPPDGSDPQDPSDPIGGNPTETSESDEGRDVKLADLEPTFISDEVRVTSRQEAHGTKRSKFWQAELVVAASDSSNVVEKVNSELALPMLLYQTHDKDDHTDDQPRVEVIYNGLKIISSIDLLKMDFETLPFAGGWYDFLGEPSSCFHMAVFGKAGQGKSTYSVQVANYLANNFGSAIYVSGEEGFCLTFQKKFRGFKVFETIVIMPFFLCAPR